MVCWRLVVQSVAMRWARVRFALRVLTCRGHWSPAPRKGASLREGKVYGHRSIHRPCGRGLTSIILHLAALRVLILGYRWVYRRNRQTRGRYRGKLMATNLPGHLIPSPDSRGILALAPGRRRDHEARLSLPPSLNLLFNVSCVFLCTFCFPGSL